MAAPLPIPPPLTPAQQHRHNAYQPPNPQNASIFQVPYILHPPQLEYLYHHFPNTRFESTNPTSHGHPCAHIERTITEGWAFASAQQAYITNNCTGLIGDIGGSVQRNAAAGRNNVWCIRPLLSPPDALSRMFNPAAFNNSCAHKIQDCNCHVYEMVTFIHSIYYFTPEEVALIISRTKLRIAVATAHLPESPIGYMFPPSPLNPMITEMTYVIDRDNNITTQVVGNMTPYVHKSPDWLRQSAHPVKDGTLIIEAIRATTNTTVYRLALIDMHIPRVVPANIELTPSLRDAAHYGTISLRGPLLRSEPMVHSMFDNMHLKSYGHNIAVWDRDGTPICLPKHLIASVAIEIAGSEINHATYIKALASARRNTININMPATIRNASIQYAAALSLIHNLELTPTLIKATFQNNYEQVLNYNDAMKFEVTFTKRVYWLARQHKWKLLAAATIFTATCLTHHYSSASVFSEVLAPAGSRIINVIENLSKQPPSIKLSQTAIDNTKIAVKASMKPTAAMLAYTVLGAPIFEEAIKRIKPINHLLPNLELLGYSMALNAMNYTLPQIAAIRLPAYIMHYVCVNMEYTNGVIMHSAFNLATVMSAVVSVHTISDDRFTAKIGWKSGIILGCLATIVAIGSYLFDKYGDHVSIEEEVKRRSNGIRDEFIQHGRSSIVQGSNAITPITLPTILAPSIDDSNVDPRFKIRVRALEHDEQHKQHAAKAVGIVEVSRLPTIFNSDQKSDLAALYGRHCINVPVPDMHEMVNFRQWVRSNLHVLFPKGKMSEYDYDSAYKLWNDRFPPSMQQRHNTARHEYETNARSSRKTHHNDSFIKISNEMCSTTDGLETKYPRLITAKKDISKVITSPWVYWFYQQILYNWDINFIVFMTNGSLPDTIGLWYTNRRKTHGRNTDLSKFDTTQESPILGGEYDVMDYFGRDNEIKSEQEYEEQTGHTPHGVIVTGPSKRESGRDDTSVGNGLINGLHDLYDKVIEHGIPIEVMINEGQYHSAVTGDDGEVLTTARYAGINEPRRRRLGLVTKAKIYTDDRDADYCSARMYRVKSNELGTEFVLGPKIGRIIARAGWLKTDASTSKPGKITTRDMRELKGNMLGLMNNVNHIPILKLYVHKTIELIDLRFQNISQSNPIANLKPIFNTQDDRKPRLVTTYEPDENWADDLVSWYEVSRKSIYEYAALLDQATELPINISTEFSRAAILRDC
jgi:hypothetical protein